MRYVLLFCGTRADREKFEALSEEELGRRYAEVGRWFAEHGPRIQSSNYLQPEETATSVRLTGEKPVVTDGPFLEGNELIGGYAEVEVDDLDGALAMAKTWPGRGTVEIRPVLTRG
jgi:hypothetical protein